MAAAHSRGARGWAAGDVPSDACASNPYTISYLSHAVDSCDLDCGCVGRCCFLNAVTRTYTGEADLRAPIGDARTVDADADTDPDATADQCRATGHDDAGADGAAGKREGMR